MALSKITYKGLLKQIGVVVESGRERALSLLNEQMLLTYWEIGRYLVEFEQAGAARAAYGTDLLNQLSKDLKARFGKGFSVSNLKNFRTFYTYYPKFPSGQIRQTSGEFELKQNAMGIRQTSGEFPLRKSDNQIRQTSGKSPSRKSQTSGQSAEEKFRTSGKLTWSHYCELMGVSDDLARAFYEIQCRKDGWSVRELKRQIDSALFTRLAASRDKKGIMQLAKKGLNISKAADLVKDPYVFEFLQIPEAHHLSEKDLETRLIDQIQAFLLELGKGFSFVARQYRITIDNEHNRVDLVFYHRILKCFVLIDLKIRKVKHQDIGQMNLYLNYFKEEENTEGDGEPIGIIIAADKNELLVKYATGSLSNQIFVSKYKLYLPDIKLLEHAVQEMIVSETSIPYNATH